MNEGIFIGVDVGSVSLNVALINRDREILGESYTRTRGEPLQTVAKVLGQILEEVGIDRVIGAAVTGSGGKLVADLLRANLVNEIVAHAKAAEFSYPDVRTVIDIGGEDSKLICLNLDPSLGATVIEDFAMNTICAAGTGSFLDQQANRLGLSIEEFSELATKSTNVPRIAGRCSVFAKTDMIHLQQEAAPEQDIIAGLCYALARNFKSNIGKGKSFARPIAFHGGVAKNKGMVRAFEDVLGLGRSGLIVPKYHASMGAIGVALISLKKGDGRFRGLEDLVHYMRTHKEESEGLPPLSGSCCVGSATAKDFKRARYVSCQDLTLWEQQKPIGAYLGIDVGSISTNVVVIDEDKKLLSRRYLLTAGRPLEAVRSGIREVGAEVGHLVNIRGVGTTGSGRYMIGEFVGADIVKNEITAQARAAVEIDPSCDTIFEIGGQDSKFISLENGVVVDFEMNKVCAAGTGSFLEEQAAKLGIRIEEDFGKLALASKYPLRLGERCTVFMESNLLHHQQRGAIRDDLVAGLSYSIVQNYLNRVVGTKRIGNNIFFQGAVAFNQGVVAAFEQVLEKPITVPPHNDVTGAIGVALVAMEEAKGKSNFRGFDAISKGRYDVSSFECQDCPNRCEVKKVAREFGPPLHYGSRCGKYDVTKRQTLAEGIPDLFAEREKLLLKTYERRSSGHLAAVGARPVRSRVSNGARKKSRKVPKIGIPRTLLFHELFPLWKAFFLELGLEVILSEGTNKKIIHDGLEHVLAETCFPIKVAHGHVLNLLGKGIDYLFLPTILNMARPSAHNTEQSFSCPYVQTSPHMIRSAIDVEANGVRLLAPVVIFGWEKKLAKASLWRIGRELGKPWSRVARAIRAAERAQANFYSALRARGREVLGSLKEGDQAIIIVSRPYNGCDPGINLNLPKKFRNLGALPIPMDYLDLDSVDLFKLFPDMYWRYGQKILAAAEIIHKDPRLNAVYITNFGCGPDSFITRFFRDKMGPKPFLQIEVDEHSADVGAITRCEAFLDSLRGVRLRQDPGGQPTGALAEVVARAKGVVSPVKDTNLSTARRKISNGVKTKPSKSPSSTGAKSPSTLSRSSKRTIYVPRMGDHAFALRAALVANGVPAEVFPESDDETLELGRKFTCGKECYPCILTTGDMVKLTKDPAFDPERSAFFMPATNGPCRFGQYNTLQRMVLDELGYHNVPIISPNQGKDFYGELGAYGKNFVRQAWRGIVGVDILDRWARKVRPYERSHGQTDSIYSACLKRLCQAILRKEDLADVMREVAKAFGRIDRDLTYKRPTIGVVGEIFVRSDPFANDFIVNRIEELGGEVLVPPIREWLFHVNRVVKLSSLIRLKPITYLKTLAIDLVQSHDEHRLLHSSRSFLGDDGEPSIKEVWRNSRRYLPSWFGEAALSLGNAVSYAQNGVCGIINVMPFTCLPGTVATAVLKAFKEEHNNIPCLVMAYDGLEQTNTRTRLEAFMHQAHQYRDKRLNAK